MGNPTGGLSRDILRGDIGQSLVELALALPLLLLILLGLADLGRAFYYTSAIASAGREAAAYVAVTASPTPANVLAKACAATGFGNGGACGPELTATDETGTGCDGVSTPGTVAVQVKYALQLISGYLVNRIFPLQTLTLRACATYPSLRS